MSDGDKRPVYRVYYNTHTDPPLVFSVDEGSHASETLVEAILLDEVRSEMKFDCSKEWPEPKCWLEVYDAFLQLDARKARFTRRQTTQRLKAA